MGGEWLKKKTTLALALLASFACVPSALAAPAETPQTADKKMREAVPPFSEHMGDRERQEIEVDLRYYAPRLRGAVEGDDFYTWRTHEHKLDYQQDLGIDTTRAPEIRVRAGMIEASYMQALLRDLRSSI